MANFASGSAGFPPSGGGFFMTLTAVPAPATGAAGWVRPDCSRRAGAAEQPQGGGEKSG